MRNLSVALLNAHYSANLGDGLLSDCLMFGLGKTVRSFPVDLAGRETITTLGGERRGQILKILNALPGPVRNMVIGRVQSHFSSTKWKPHFVKNLKNSDIAIIGGGNLIADQDLNFPTKIHAALDVAQGLNLPCHLYAVGVGAHFSQKGEALFNEAFSRANIRSVHVRDVKSQTNWDKHFAASSGCKAQIVWDPGLLASRTWPVPVTDRIGPIRVGIISPNELSYHEGEGDSPDITQWYKLFIEGLIASGKTVRLFSNGSPEDTRYLKEEIAPIFGSIGFDIPENQEALSRLTAHADLVAAFRLHALIPATSYNRPILALAWDAKVRSFAEKIGRPGSCVNIQDTGPEDAVKIAIQEVDKKPDFSQQVNEAVVEIETFASFIKSGGKQ